jgi:hypothetical protein
MVSPVRPAYLSLTALRYIRVFCSSRTFCTQGPSLIVIFRKYCLVHGFTGRHENPFTSRGPKCPDFDVRI